MHKPSDISRVCASALLDAYRRNDASRMYQIAFEVRIMGMFHASDFGESERLDLLGGIARELHRSSSLGKSRDADPYVKLLLHLSNPERSESGFTHNG